MLNIDKRASFKIENDTLETKDDFLAYCIYQATDTLGKCISELNQKRFFKKKLDVEKLKEYTAEAAGCMRALSEILCLDLPENEDIIEQMDVYPSETAVDPFLMFLGSLSVLEEISANIWIDNHPHGSAEFHACMEEPLLDFFTMIHFIDSRFNFKL